MWGNDFDAPIKDQLPYGFSIGYNILKYAVDPSIFGDVYAEKPYLYGPALTSFNKIQVVNAKSKAIEWPGVIETENIQNENEGEYNYIPPSDSSSRRKFYLTEANRKEFTFETNFGEKDTTQYGFDFYTPYLDLGKQFAIKLPGFSLNVEGYAKGQPLRYTLKNYKTGDVYLVVAMKLHKDE